MLFNAQSTLCITVSMSILLSALTEVFFFPLTYPSFFFLFPPVRLLEGQTTLSLSITQLLFMMSTLFYQLTIILLSHTGTETCKLYTYMYIHINAYSKYLLCINAHIVHHIVLVLAHIQCTHRQTCTHFVYVDI